MADITDKLIKQSNGTQPLPTTLSAQKNSGATTASLNAATGWDTTTAKHIRMYKTKVVNGQTVPDWDFVCFYKGTLSGTTLSNLTLVWSSTGSDQTFGIGDTCDLSYTSGYGEDLYSALSTHLDQDGTLKADSVDVTAVIKDGVITRPKLASGFATEITGGWLTGDLPAVSSVTANGNRSYDITFGSTVASTLSEGMRLRTTRTVAAPQTSFALDGSNDYYNDTSVSGMTFTDDFSVSAWVYMTEYDGGATQVICSRYNGTSGWRFGISPEGFVDLIGFNAAAGNYSRVNSYQSIPINKWVHVAAQLDMSSYPTVSSTTSYVMLDGVNVPAQVLRAGSNPTALIQAGNLEIGSTNGGTLPFAGYIDQVAIYSAKVTQATHLAAMNQGLTGSETNLISAYSNGSTTDLAATGNNLTAQNGATTASVSPFGNNATSSTLDYALIQKVNAAVVTVQIPEGCTIPTTGGITSVAYSTQANPYGWVSDDGKWEVSAIYRVQQTAKANTSYAQWYGNQIAVPTGAWICGYHVPGYMPVSATGAVARYQLSTSTSASTDITFGVVVGNTNSGLNAYNKADVYAPLTVSSQTTYYVIAYTTAAAGTYGIDSDDELDAITLIPSGL